MKKTIISLLFVLSICTLSGCSSNDATPEEDHVSFSVNSGFYEEAQTVSLSCNVKDAIIYYTLDGSTPNQESNVYEEPIHIEERTSSANVLSAQKDISVSNKYIPNFPVDKATVIRAIAYLPDGTTTPLTQATYFVGLDRAKYNDVPVISISTDFDNFYDYETGIYILGKTHDDWIAEDPSRKHLDGWQQHGNYSNRGKEWERPVSVELITADGSDGFMQNMGIRIMGGASRNQTQKSLKLIAREEYGEKNLHYALIPDNFNSQGELITKYKSFVLRVGGNDADFARVRDPYLQSLVADADFMTQQTTPCVVFINGEYWGMYAITEDYTDNLIENNYGVDNKNVILIKRGEVEEGEEDDLALFRDMYLYIAQNDMSSDIHYEAACELIDIDSFVDYFAFQLYIVNQDSIFENNNWRMWRVRNADMATEYSDGKWRFAAYDNDYSTGIYSGSESASTNNISSIIAQSSPSQRQDNIEHYVPIELFRSLLKSDEFRSKLILALCDMRNIYFESKHAKKILNDMAADYIPLMSDTYKRFGPDWIANQDAEKYSTDKIEELSRYMAGRYLMMPKILERAFDLGSASNLSISTEEPAMGTILLNGRVLDLNSKFSGIYYEETTVTVTALPAEGYKFVGWETNSKLIEDSSSATLEFNVSAPVSLKAIFEKK